MSYILDALRRSEQERHQEQLKSLAGHDSLIHAGQNKTHLWPYLLIGVLVINAGVFLWIHFENKAVLSQTEEMISQSRSTETDNSQGVSEPLSFEKPLVEDGHSPLVRAAPTKPQAQEPQPQVLANQAKVNDTSEGDVNLSSQSASSNASTAGVSVASVSEIEPEPGEVYIDGGLLIQPKNKSVTRPMPEHFSPIGNPTVSVASVPIYTQQAESGSAFAEESESFRDVPYLREKNTSFQKSIPSLTFNSHIYSDVPSARRVMINNIYLKEGQQLSGLEVVSIGEVDIVFDKGGQLFKRPVMRDW